MKGRCGLAAASYALRRRGGKSAAFGVAPGVKFFDKFLSIKDPVCYAGASRHIFPCEKTPHLRVAIFQNFVDTTGRRKP
jgi:hypothetical protein